MTFHLFVNINRDSYRHFYAINLHFTDFNQMMTDKIVNLYGQKTPKVCDLCSTGIRYTFDKKGRLLLYLFNMN